MEVDWGKVGRFIGPHGTTLININENPNKPGEFLIHGGELYMFEGWTWFTPPICTSTLNKHSEGRVVDILRRSFEYLTNKKVEHSPKMRA